jgi:hypothetical protein
MFIHHYKSNDWHIAAFKRLLLYEVSIMREWCYYTYGVPGFFWKDDIYNGEVHFKNEEDLLLFLLRWQG